MDNSSRDQIIKENRREYYKRLLGKYGPARDNVPLNENSSDASALIIKENQRKYCEGLLKKYAAPSDMG